MKWMTEIEAINPETGELNLWSGPIIEAPNAEIAQHYLNEHGMGYCKVTDEFIYSEDVREVEYIYCLN